MNLTKQTKILMFVFGTLIIAASAATTFSFFFTNLPAIVPLPVFGQTIAGIISGTLGVIIFEVGALVWLRAYLNGSDNNDQRGIALTMSALDITGGAVASFAQIIIAGTNLIDLSPTGRFYIGIVSLIAIAFALVANFIGVWMFQKESNESKAAIREANRRAKIQAEEERQADHLDSLIAQKVRQKLEQSADGLAEEKAADIVGDRIRFERKGQTNERSNPRSISPIIYPTQERPNGTPKA